jgi:hypothetical protein
MEYPSLHVSRAESGVSLEVPSGPQSEKKQTKKDGPIVGAFHGHSEEIFRSKDLSTKSSTNQFYSKQTKENNQNYKEQESDLKKAFKEFQSNLSYNSNCQIHEKRVNVVRAKGPPTSNKMTYSKLFDLRSHLYVSNPYTGPGNIQKRLSLINSK